MKVNQTKETGKLIRLTVSALWCIIIIQQSLIAIRSALKEEAQGESWTLLEQHQVAGGADDFSIRGWADIKLPKVLFVDAGKKKKKEKSEVVVISVNNAQPKGYGGGMYPIFVPSCGGHGGFGGRKRRSVGLN